MKASKGDIVYIHNLTSVDYFGTVTWAGPDGRLTVRLADGGHRDILRTIQEKATVLAVSPRPEPSKLNEDWFNKQREVRLPPPEKIAKAKRKMVIPKIAAAFRDMCQYHDRLERWCEL